MMITWRIGGFFNTEPMMDYGQVISGLNELIVVNNDRRKEYEHAMNSTGDEALKEVFHRYLSQSLQFTGTLCTWVTSYGISVFQPVKKMNFSRRLKTFVRSLFPSPQREEIITACEYREAVAISIYKKILSINKLPYEAVVEIKRQKEHIEKAFREMTLLASPTILFE